jgi:putative nucleotidyltransferase with HDIG domain
MTAAATSTLKQIPTREVQVGMYIVSLDGAWLDHPFWKTKFVLTELADLRALQASKVKSCWVDLAKSRLPAVGPQPSPKTAEAAAPAAAAASAASASPLRAAAVAAAAVRDANPSTSEEMRRAGAILNKSRKAVTAMFAEARLGKAIDTDGCAEVVEDISTSVLRNPGALVSLVRLKTQDDYTYMHSVAVCALMVALARELKLDDAQCRTAGLAGLLHDIGKATVPLEVLVKPGKLTPVEYEQMRSHPEAGYDLLKGGRAGDDAMDVARHHHERVDGTGYPDRLTGVQLSLLARMSAVCDVYDAVTSNRPYKAGWDPAEAIARMASWSGHFDPPVFASFVKSLGIYPSGSLVRLESGRLAIVMEQNPQALTAPVVQVFFSTRSNMPIPLARVDLSRSGEHDRIVGRESPQKWGFAHLDHLWSDSAQASRG